MNNRLNLLELRWWFYRKILSYHSFDSPIKITQYQIKKWLKRNDDNSVHKVRVLKFKNTTKYYENKCKSKVQISVSENVYSQKQFGKIWISISMHRIVLCVNNMKKGSKLICTTVIKKYLELDKNRLKSSVINRISTNIYIGFSNEIWQLA